MAKILIIHNILWSHYKAAVFSKLHELSISEGMDILVAQIAVNEKGRKRLGDIDLSIHRYPYKLLFEKSIEEVKAHQKAYKILSIIKDYKPDIVVIPGWNDLAYWIVALYCKIKGIKIVLSVDSTEFDHPRKFYKEAIKTILVKNANAYFCYGSASKDYLIKLGAQKHKVFVRVQATDNDSISKLCESIRKDRDSLKKSIGLKEKNFIYVGRISPEKNLDCLIKAFNKVKKEDRNQEWGLIIVGDGPEKEKIYSLVKELRLEKDVYFTGSKKWNEVPKYYALADVFVLPSLSEPWGLVVNEAMVCKLPVIVSKRAGAYYDLVKEGENGFGFDPTNCNELAEKMLKFINDEADKKLMGEMSVKVISKYIPEEAAKQMIECFKKLGDINRGTML